MVNSCSYPQLHEHVHGGRCPDALLSCPLREAVGCMQKVREYVVIHVCTYVYVCVDIHTTCV